MFDKISLLVKGSPENNTIAAFSFATRRYCSHKGSNGIMESHLHTIVPYGKSHTMQSTLPSGILFIPSRQSSLYILFSSIMLYIICSLLFLHRHPRFRVIQCGEHFAVNLPHQVRVPIIEIAYHLQRTEHELLQWGKLDLLYEETLAEVGATR